ncbi:MAG: hypothetical protein KIT68_12090, partial [Phycisphaeraceae bacterium]|nr:hypothetical protein [Phycisphaeraceae bacterium]
GHAGGWNLYEYCHGDYFNFLDPTGLDEIGWWDTILYAVGLGESGGAAAVWGGFASGLVEHPTNVAVGVYKLAREPVVLAAHAVGAIDRETMVDYSIVGGITYTATLAGRGDTGAGLGVLASATWDAAKRDLALAASGHLEAIGAWSFNLGALAAPAAAARVAATAGQASARAGAAATVRIAEATSIAGPGIGTGSVRVSSTIVGPAASETGSIVQFLVTGERLAVPTKMRAGMNTEYVISRTGHVVPVFGKAQVTGTAGHAATSRMIALQWATSGDYAAVYLNRAWRTAVDYPGASRCQPDVLGVRLNSRIDAMEVASRSDKPAILQFRLNRAMQFLPVELRGRARVIEPFQRWGTP